jgi:Rrf2 family protein
MLRLSRKALYAIEAVLDIAMHARGRPVQSREITERQNIPRRYLEPALQALVREGLLVGVRGPRGGYSLGRERRRITVGEIARIVSATEAAGDPLEEESGSELGHEIVRPLCREAIEEVMARLDRVTLEELCARARQERLAPKRDATTDFVI